MEEILDPGRTIIDPHHHLWTVASKAFPKYELDDLRRDTGGGHHVIKTVFVECDTAYRPEGPEHLRVVGETEYVARVAEASTDGAGAEIAAIVAAADLCLGEAVEEVLVAHEVAGAGKFRGIRHRLAHDDYPVFGRAVATTPGLAARPSFRQGLARLGALGYSFDAWCFHPQLPEVVDLARAQPDVPIVVNHLGGPLGVGPYTDRREVRAFWREQMVALAACPNVVLKVGGIGMTFYGADWHLRQESVSSEEIAAHWGDDVRFCIDTFGPDRAMFESNFPVDSLSCTYPVLWNAFKRMAEGYSEAEKHDLFHATAARTYRID